MEGFRELHNNTVPKKHDSQNNTPLNITPLTHVSDGLYIECPRQVTTPIEQHSALFMSSFHLNYSDTSHNATNKGYKIFPSCIPPHSCQPSFLWYDGKHGRKLIDSVSVSAKRNPASPRAQLWFKEFLRLNHPA
jgi:hypothetical protein